MHNCHAWLAMLDVAVDVCHAESRRGTRELCVLHALTSVITRGNVKL